MVLIRGIILLLWGILASGFNDKIRHKSSYENCTIERYQRKFEILPGTGWDNLENLEMGRVLNLNFSKCLFSNDNRYLIPSGLTLSPEKVSHVELFSQVFEHFMNYTSTTSASVNINAEGGYDGFKAGGSFSYEHQRVKNDQMQTKSLFTRVQLRYKLFQSSFEPDTFLYPAFKNRILDIAALIMENKDYLYPEYLADLIVRDYGTHVIRSIEAGAVLSKTDALDTSYVKDQNGDKSTIGASAHASFLSYFSISAKFQTKTDTEKTDEYNKKCSNTHIDTIGGSLFGSNTSLKTWEDSVINNLVPIDRRGEPIYYVLTQRALPELSGDIVLKVYGLIKKAVERYYIKNGRKGCMDINSPNFNSDANIDAGNCKAVDVYFTMGGTFQICYDYYDLCSMISQKNSLTGDYTCPTGYTPIKLYNGLESCYIYSIYYSEIYCVYVDTYWCYPHSDGSLINGYQFGGFISASMSSCPLDYMPIQMGLGITVCVTSNHDPTNQYAVKFGGFFSCNVGNPLAQFNFKNKTRFMESVRKKDLSIWPKSCPDGYVAHVANIYRGCQIFYCTESKKVLFGPSKVLLRPPFIELDYNPNSTHVNTFTNKQGHTFIKDHTGSWIKNSAGTINNSLLIGFLVALTMGTIIGCLLVVFLQRRFYRISIQKTNMETFCANANRNGYGTMNNDENV